MRHKFRESIAVMALSAFVLASCGGGGGNGGAAPPVSVSPTPSPTPSSTACALSSRQSFVKSVIDEWYLFPNDVATGVNPASHSTVQSYIDALVAPARAMGKDRYFTYLTSIAAENAFFSTGSSAGFGVRLSYVTASGRVLIAEAFEGTPALAAGIDRGAEIIAIGTSTGNLRTVSSIIASEGTAGVTNALGPNDAGIQRVLRITDAAGTRDVTVTKAAYDLDPVSDRYGATTISDGGKTYGYINLRSFISSADPQLRTAMLSFRNQGITDIIIDLRYNGGGLVSTAELFGDLLGRNRSTSELFSQTNFRAEKSVNNDRHFFQTRPESIAPTHIAFIGTGATASASELVINGMLPYLGTNMTLIGANTFGKPVGQIALDKAECDDRMRVIAFSTGNALTAGDYFDGLAPKISNSCAAVDDLAFPLGDAREASVKAAIDFLAGRACATSRIAGAEVGASSAQATLEGKMPDKKMLEPADPSAAQRQVPGLF